MMKNIHFHGLNFSDQNKFCSQLEGEKVAPGKRYVCLPYYDEKHASSLFMLNDTLQLLLAPKCCCQLWMV